MSEKKSAEIICLTSQHLPTGEPDARLIDNIQDILKKAKRGEIAGFAAVVVETNHHIRVTVAPGHSDYTRLVAGASALFYETNKQWAEGNE